MGFIPRPVPLPPEALRTVPNHSNSPGGLEPHRCGGQLALRAGAGPPRPGPNGPGGRRKHRPPSTETPTVRSLNFPRHEMS